MKSKHKPKIVTVVIRGCLFRVERSRAGELEALEKEALRKDWALNRLP